MAGVICSARIRADDVLSLGPLATRVDSDARVLVYNVVRNPGLPIAGIVSLTGASADLVDPIPPFTCVRPLTAIPNRVAKLLDTNLVTGKAFFRGSRCGGV